MVESSYLYRALLSYNYFPMVRLNREELPPLFTTELLTPEIADRFLFALSDGTSQVQSPRMGSDQIEYRTTRYNNVSRIMHIPTPLSYIQLCGQLRDSWSNPEVNRICKNPSSKVRPEQHKDGRVITMDGYEKEIGGRVVVMGREDQEHDTLTLLRETTGLSYYVEADVSACFSSIYSHSIPWALVGHDSAKRNWKESNWYNLIDKYQRSMKRLETQGVPIGPATSNIICEIVLYPVDEALRSMGYTFSRYIDDYTAYTATREQAEQFVRDLECELSKYLLYLNASKIKIETLPRPTVVPWILDLRSRLPDSPSMSARHVIDYLDFAVSLNKQEPDGSVVKYAARSIARRLSEDGHRAYCAYLLNLAVHHPVVLPILCNVVADTPLPIDSSLLSKLVKRHILYRRSDAVTWGIYLHKITQNPIPFELAAEVVNSGDCMSMATLLAISEHEDQVASFVSTLDAGYMYRLDQYWILIHELNRRGALSSGGDLAAYIRHTGLELLKNEQVTFIVEPENSTMEVEEPFDWLSK